MELGHKYGVQVYPCLSDSRVRGETRFRRSSFGELSRPGDEPAWKAGADGVHLFNSFNPNAAIWKELGDPEALATKDKLYFVHTRDDRPQRFLACGLDYRTVDLLGPGHGRQVTVGKPVCVSMPVGDDLAAAKSGGKQPAVKLHLEAPTVSSASQLEVTINGTKLTDGTIDDGWIDYTVPLSAMRCGANQIEIAAGSSIPSDAPWNIVFDGEKKPGRGWNRDRGSERTVEEAEDGALFLADRGEESGDYLYYRHPWGADPEGKAIIEAEAKAEAGSSFVIFSNGESGERLGIWPDRIELFHHRKLQHAMDTTDAFHLYRMEVDGQDLKVFVDGKMAINAPGVLKPRSGYIRNQVSFGAANSPMMGEASWKAFRARSTGLVCQDLVLSVSYGE